ncbi:hypothetical protein AN277_0204685 [Rothia kristinae]|uniref:Uncharacterized protein n=1 Tax=Rothia kristinae TaxID=37923 RepID=A0A199NTH6_9MICC|nr:hypothetical protein AN277_0204685 [Rothia kristinae]
MIRAEAGVHSMPSDSCRGSTAWTGPFSAKISFTWSSKLGARKAGAVVSSPAGTKEPSCSPPRRIRRIRGVTSWTESTRTVRTTRGWTLIRCWAMASFRRRANRGICR